jgi:hypothetical protein
MLWRKGHYGGRSEIAARNDADYTLLPWQHWPGAKVRGKVK